ncbi:MAG TPA: OpcA/G6PD domain-containing protein [Candidatus Tyrphobacter sp.]
MSVNVRIATMALLVFVEEDRLADWARERARILASRHASCVVVLNAAKSEEAPERSEDWVEVGVQGSSPEHVQALAASLLPAGVPRILLWVSERTTSDARFVALAPEMRTILLDSSRACDDASALKDLVAFREKDPENVSIHDLAYLRLAPWQEVVADFFDERAFVEDLFDLNKVAIACGSDAEGYYLLGWLASRLSWEPAGDHTFRPRRGARTIAYEIVRDGAPRRVRRITLDSRATRFQAALCDGDGIAVNLEVTGAKQRPTRVAPLHDVDIASLLERAILHDQLDPVFCEALAVAGQLLAQA